MKPRGKAHTKNQLSTNHAPVTRYEDATPERQPNSRLKANKATPPQQDQRSRSQQQQSKDQLTRSRIINTDTSAQDFKLPEIETDRSKKKIQFTESSRKPVTKSRQLLLNQSVTSEKRSLNVSRSSVGSRATALTRTLPPKAGGKTLKPKQEFSEFQQNSRESSARPSKNSKTNSRKSSSSKLAQEIMRINNDPKMSPRSKKRILNRLNPGGSKLNQSMNDKSMIMQMQGKLQSLTKQELLKLKNYPVGNCPYCLTSRVNIIDLDCEHQFCSKCCINLIKITKIKKGLNYFSKTNEEIIKCPKCHQINILSKEKHQEMLDVREYESQRIRQMEKNQEALKSNYTGPPCQLCSQTYDKPPLPAQFECLNCESTLLCYDCKIRHLKNPRYKNHKAVKYVATSNMMRAEDMICPDHKEKYRLYCFTEEKPLCLECNNPQSTKHSTHYVKSLSAVLEQADHEKEQLKQDILDELEKVDSAIQYFSGIEDIFVGQKNLYLKKLTADFEVIYKLVERKHAELKDKISTLYDNYLKEAYQYVEGLSAIKETIQSLDKMEIKLDVEQVNLNKSLMYRLREIETELDFELQGQDMDLIESRFIFEPFHKIEKSLIQYDFFPIQNTLLKNLEKIFLEGNSKIIQPDHLTADFLMIMPPKMQKAELIYQHSAELIAIQVETNQVKSKAEEKMMQPDGPLGMSSNEPSAPATGSQRFHLKCDNRGPTLMIIKANEGHIFGGFTPTSWVSEFMYSECDDAYLFSITDGKGRKPIKCPIKHEKKDKAIKQNEKSYSPAFGEANISDLFIAFKNLSNSYSMLGNVYKLPKGFKGETFLAGRHNEWKIDEIEIWAISS